MAHALPRLSIIGAGHLGRSLARLWHEAGVFTIGDVVTRSEASAREAVDFVGAGRAVAAGAALQAAELFLIATPDSMIADAAQALQASGVVDSGSTVFHCSGALASDVLAAAKPAQVASIHPVFSFAQPAQAVTAFTGAWCGAEGERSALDRLIPAFTALGAQVVEIDSSKKTLYHAAAVIGSNYLVTLIEAACQAYEAAGIARTDALRMLRPLAEGALDNALRVGPQKALSGPIARGDWTTVHAHEQALREANPELADFYRMMGERTADLKRDQQSG